MRIRDVLGDLIAILCLICIWVGLLFIGYAVVG